MKLNLFKVFTVIKIIVYLVNIGYVNHSKFDDILCISIF